MTSYIDEIINETIAVTPKVGYNVCLFDDYEPVGSKLVVLEHFNTKEEADKFANNYGEGLTLYVYGAEVASEINVSSKKNHNIDTYLNMAMDDYEDGTTRDNDRYENTNYGKEFEEQEHPRDDSGKFTDGAEKLNKDKLKEKIIPSKKMYDLQTNVEGVVNDKINQAIDDMGIRDKVKEFSMQGSFAKGTDLPASGSDLDIFIVFNKNVSNEDKDKWGLEVGKRVLSKELSDKEGWTDFSVEDITATGQYAEAYFKKDGTQMEVQIVPTIDLSLKEINNKTYDDGTPIKEIGMSRTPHQTVYMQEALKGKTDQVRMLKQFMKDTYIYDSSMKSQGFSGYSAEVLIDKLDTFDNVIDFFSTMKQGAMVDKNGTHVPNATSKKNLIHLIDPIDKNRDLMSAFSPMKIGRTIQTAKYWKEHGTSPYNDGEKPPKTNMDSVTVKYQNTEENEDTLVGQSKSSQASIMNKLNSLGFETVVEQENVNGMKIEIPRTKMNNPFKDNGETIITIGIVKSNIPPTVKDKGISLTPPNPKVPVDRWNQQIQSYRDNNPDVEFVEEDGKLRAIKKRQFTNVADALQHITSTMLDQSGISKGIAKDMKNGVKISTKDNDDFENMF